jgi:hypothetical protein
VLFGGGPEELKIDLSIAVAYLQAQVLKGVAHEISPHTKKFD